MGPTPILIQRDTSQLILSKSLRILTTARVQVDAFIQLFPMTADPRDIGTDEHHGIWQSSKYYHHVPY